MNNMQESRVHASLHPRAWKQFKNFDCNEFEGLYRLGIGLDAKIVDKMLYAMDAIQPTVTTGSVPTPVQFLQYWLPGFVYILTAARNIDKMIGMSTVGSFEDVQIVQPIMELVNSPVPYGDYTNVPFSSWNTNFEYRNIIRFEEGLRVGMLESMQAARIRVDSAASKRQSSALALEIIRNYIGFYGYNNGNNKTYGFLNDPGEPAYVTVPNGASGSPLWANKTFLEIQKDIKNMISSLRNQAQDQIDPEDTDITLGLATVVVDYLSTTSDFGISVREWMKEAYPRIRVVSAPELNAANGGANVAYMFAESVSDGYSTDGGRVFDQWVPTKFMTLGVQQLPKAYIEDYANATAGTVCKRPYGIVRRSGV